MHPLSFSGHRGPVYTLANGAAPGTFYSGSGDGSVARWDVARPDSGSSVLVVGQAIFSMLPLPQHGILLVGTESGDMHVVDTQAGKEVQLLKAHNKGLYSILALPDGRVVCAGGDGSISIWTISGRRLSFSRQIPLSEDKLRDLAVDPKGEQLAVACGDGTIRILDPQLFNELFTLQVHASSDPIEGVAGDDASKGMSALAYHPTKTVLLSGGKDGYLRMWQSSDQYRAVLHFPAHKGTIYTIAFSPDGSRCATASRDKSAKVWDAGTFAPIQRLDRNAGGHTHSVNNVLWCGSILLTGSDDRRILGWPTP